MRGGWGGMVLLAAALAAWPFYDMLTATEALSWAEATLNCIGLGLALIGLVGSVVMMANCMSEK